MKVAMTLTGAKSISEITQDSLVQGLGKELPAALAPDGERECGIVVCAPPPNPLPSGEWGPFGAVCTPSL